MNTWLYLYECLVNFIELKTLFFYEILWIAFTSLIIYFALHATCWWFSLQIEREALAITSNSVNAIEAEFETLIQWRHRCNHWNMINQCLVVKACACHWKYFITSRHMASFSTQQRANNNWYNQELHFSCRQLKRLTSDIPLSLLSLFWHKYAIHEQSYFPLASHSC